MCIHECMHACLIAYVHTYACMGVCMYQQHYSHIGAATFDNAHGSSATQRVKDRIAAHLQTATPVLWVEYVCANASLV